MDQMELVKTAIFDEDLIDKVICSNDPEVFRVALERSDCPPELLVDLSQTPVLEIRRAVARHKNTPVLTRKRMTRDPDPEVAAAAERAK